MNQPANSNSLKFFCQTGSPLEKKIRLLNFYNKKYAHFLDKLLVLYEYLQLMSQAILSHSTSSGQDIPDNQFAFRLVIWFFQIVNPSHLFLFEKNEAFTTTILVIAFFFTIIKLLIFVYVICISFWDFKQIQLLVSIWRILFKIQGRMMCFLLSSLWIRTILTVSAGEFSFFGMNRIGSLSIAGIMIGLEYFFSFFMEIQFCFRLPNKSFLSSKGCQLQVITLVQKLSLHILELTMKSISEVRFWVFNTINLVFTIFRSYHFYSKLPLYNFEALLYQGDLISLVTSLHLSCFLKTLLKTEYFLGEAISFITVLWVILAVLMVKASRELVNSIILDLLTKQINGPPELLVHKVSAAKQLRKLEKKPGAKSEKYHFTYLLRTIGSVKIENVFGINTNLNMANKKQANRIFVQYLEGLCMKYPKNSLIKLHLAQICAKDWELYTKALKIISELGQSKLSSNYLSSAFLLNEVEKSISSQHDSENVDLDIITYMKSHIFIEGLKKDINHQIDFRISICNNIIGEVANIGQIFDSAQSISKSKIDIQKKINLLSHSVPDYYIEPLRICAEYYLLLNYSFEDFKKYSELYVKKYFKYEKHFTGLNFTNENLYQDSNAFLILSGQKVDNGKILFCTKALQDLCGGDKSSYEGAHISSLFPPSLQVLYSELFKQIFESKKKNILNKIIRTYLYHKKKFITEVEFYIRVHPYITKNLYLDMIIRKVPTSRDYILVKENGDIEGMSKTASNILGINSSTPSSNVNIKSLSEELYMANIAFNMVHKSRLNKNQSLTTNQEFINEKMSLNFTEDMDPANSMTYNKALELYTYYTSRFMKVELTPVEYTLNKTRDLFQSRGQNYLCQISILPYESVFLKLISLDESSSEDDPFQDKTPSEDTLKKMERSVKVQKINEEIEDEEIDQNLDNIQIIGSENINCSEKKDNICLDYYSKRESRFLNTEENLLSPKSVSPSQAKLQTFSARVRQVIIVNHVTQRMPNSLVTFKESPKSKKSEKNLIRIYSGIHNNPISQTYQKLNMNRAFYRALETKSYPRSFNVLCLLFYGAILLTLTSQIILKIVTDNTLTDLALKKDLLKYNQYRFYRMVVMQMVCRGGFMQVSGAFTAEDLGGTGSPVKDVVGILEVYREDLAVQNQGIIDRVDSLEPEIKEILFANDIRIHGSIYDSEEPTQKNITQFQLVDEIINAVRRIASLSNPSSIEGYHALNFVVLNTFNDFVSKNTEITRIFVESVQKQKDFYQDVISLGMILTPFLLVGVILMLIFIIWKQYLREKRHMLALIKLDQNQVKDIAAKLKKLKKCLSDEENFEIMDSTEILGIMDAWPRDLRSNYRKKSETQIVEASTTMKRYYGYSIKSVFYIMVLIVVVVWNFFSAQNSTNIIYARQRQLDFANYISTKVPIYCASQVEMFDSNNTNLIEQQYPLSYLLRGIDEIKAIQSQIAENFLENDRTYDPQVQAMLFQNNQQCKGFTLPSHINYCKFLVNKGLPVNLLPLMAVFETQLQVKLQDFYEADRSTLRRSVIWGLKNIGDMLPTFSLIAVEAQLLARIIDNNLTASISEVQSQRSLILMVFSLSLVLVSLVVWFKILVKLREINNDFKKVLQVFPPKLILSSFFLKTFLKNTSEGYLYDF